MTGACRIAIPDREWRQPTLPRKVFLMPIARVERCVVPPEAGRPSEVPRRLAEWV